MVVKKIVEINIEFLSLLIFYTKYREKERNNHARNICIEESRDADG